MPRLCCGCLSRRKHKSFPIHEKHNDAEVTKIFIRHVENIRITPPPPPITKCQQDKKTISKTTIKKKSIDNEINYKTQLFDNKQTIKENNLVDSRTPVLKLFHKSKQIKTSLPMTIKNISEENNEKTATNTGSSWSESTNRESYGHNKRSKTKIQSFAENFDLSEETTVEKNNISQSKKISNDIKSSAKSKLVLENVRKMIKEQNNQQKESIRL